MTGTEDRKMGLIAFTTEMAGIRLLYIQTKQVGLDGERKVDRTERLGQQQSHSTERKD